MISKTEKKQDGGKPIDSGANSYYSDSYGLGDEEAYGDFDTLDEGESFGEPEVLDSDSLYREISDLAATAKSQGVSADLLKQLEEKKSLLTQSAALSPDKRNEVLAGIAADLETLQASMSADLEQAPQRDALKKELQELRGELKSENIDEDTKGAVVKECSDAEQALKNHDLDGAENLYSEAKGEFDEAKSAAQEKAAQEKSDREGSAKELKAKIQDSNLPQDGKDALVQQVENLENSWQGQEPNPENVHDALKAIEKDYKHEKKVQSLKDALVGFATKIQTTGDEDMDKVIQDLAGKFKAALDNGDWGSVLSMLQDKSVDQNALLMGIDQIVGILFYGMAGKDEKAFEQFLDLIPKDVRQAMINALKASPDYNRTCEVSPEDMEKLNIYGNTFATEASRLEESMQKEDITGDDGEITVGSTSGSSPGDSSAESK
ncbi:MAG: hypothetical protein K8R69_09690 [Deltaproteobacteria bacterium]|nr:hypothetical protein [Deltaproteobacteria bacterium]